MARKFLEDMKKVKKEPISRKVEYFKPEKQVEPEPTDSIEYEETYVSPQRKRSGSRYGIWVVALASLVFLLFSFSYIFAGAKVTLSPRTEELVLNQKFSAVKNGAGGELPFDLVVISGEENKNVEGGEERDVSIHAEGRVIIYNALNSLPQRLNIDTRLEGSNGKIYKTKIATVVPAMLDKVPGSVEVEIYGAEGGAEYNSKPLDFKILGFKGTPKYAGFYARSTGDIKGGFAGKQREISEEAKAALRAELKTSLEAKLMAKATGQIPPGFILFKNAAFLQIDEENFTSAASSAQSNLVRVALKGTLYGILFEEKALTKKIIEKSFPGEEDNEVYIKNIRDFDFSLLGEVNFAQAKTVIFNLSGSGEAVWKVDEEKLLVDILKKKKNDFNQILAGYPNILSANLSLRPFWKRSLPEEKEDIELEVKYPE